MTGSAWHWLRLPSGGVLNMALVTAIWTHPEDQRGGVTVYCIGSVHVIDDADADAILAWVPGEPVAAEPDGETGE